MTQQFLLIDNLRYLAIIIIIIIIIIITIFIGILQDTSKHKKTEEKMITKISTWNAQADCEHGDGRRPHSPL